MTTLLFDNHSRTRIQHWDQALNQPVHIKLVRPEKSAQTQTAKTGTPPAPADQFADMAVQLQEQASRLTIDVKEESVELPGFMLKENILFSAFPLHRELPPFLTALSLLNETTIPVPEPVLTRLDRMDIPVRLKLYIALHCPHCPKMVETLIPLALYSPLIRLDIIDGSLFEDAARADGVLSAPCLILDDDFRWTGAVSAEEIADMILDRSPDKLSADTLKNIMEQGDAEWITRQMVDAGKIFNAFVTLLCHPTWSVRLGAMVVVEGLAEEAPELTADLCPMLIREFDKKNLSVQGDILYALGLAGDDDTRHWIETRIESFSHPDLIDAAQEALDTLAE